MKTHTTPALPRNAIMRAALAKINECRAKCPGIGGDVDAMNLRAMIKRNEWQRSTTDQAAMRLESLAKALDVEAADEVAALRAIPLFEAAPDMLAALNSLFSSKVAGQRILTSQWACAKSATDKATV